MSKHTPGPWFQSGQFDSDLSVEIYNGNEQLIAEIVPMMDDWSEEEIANAHLIAAAPDLLNACQVVVAYLDGLENSTDQVLDAELARIRRRVHAPLRAALDPAIAKAKGGPI